MLAAVVVGVSVVPVAAAAAPSVSIATAYTYEPSTTTFTSYAATATCTAGSTLVGGGAELTNKGTPVGVAAPTGTLGGNPPLLSTTPVSNDGDVTLGVYPSSASGTQSPQATTSPGSWTAAGGYAGKAPGNDYLTSYALCASNVTSATVVQVAATATGSLGPVTATCPAGDSLVGGAGGYTGFNNGSTQTDIFDSYPSDPNGNVLAADPTSWTVQGNSSSASGATTIAIALCATGVTVPTEVETASTSASSVAGGADVTATADCPTGATLLGGGSEITDTPSGPGTAGQGVHLIGDYPSDGSGNAIVSGSAQDWTVTAQNGGQTLTSLGTETFALCDSASVPGPPIVGRATAGNASASVAFSAPYAIGGLPITSYTVTATDLTNSGRGGQTASGTTSPLTVTGLTDGDAYVFSVTATNSIGTGQPSSADSEVVTPRATPTTSTTSAKLPAVAATASKPLKVEARLDARGEVPSPKHTVSGALGLLSGTLTKIKTGYSFAWHLSYSKTSGRATVTDVQHAASAKHRGTVITVLCRNCESGAHGEIHVSAGEVSLLLGGKLYVNLATRRNQSGEIRGHLTRYG